MTVLRGEHLAKAYKTRKVVTDLSLEVKCSAQRESIWVWATPCR